MKPCIASSLISYNAKDFKSQRSAAKYLGVHESTLSRAVTGDRGRISSADHIVISEVVEPDQPSVVV